MRGDLIISKTIDTSQARLEIEWAESVGQSLSCWMNGNIYPAGIINVEGAVIRSVVVDYVKDKAKGPGLPHVTIIAANRLVRLPETSDVKELLTAAESAMSGVASVVIAVCEPVAWL